MKKPGGTICSAEQSWQPKPVDAKRYRHKQFYSL